MPLNTNLAAHLKPEHQQTTLNISDQPSDKTIAVLPFANRSASEEIEYFSDGMTEGVINALAKVEGLKVTSKTSSFYFKGKQLPSPEIGE